MLSQWRKDVVLTVPQSKISGALIHLVQERIKSVYLPISLIPQGHLREIIMLPRLQRQDNFNQFAPDAIPIQLLDFLKQSLLGIWNRRPFEVGAIAEVRRGGSCGPPLENVAKRGERNGHGKLPSKILAKKLGERRAGVVWEEMNP
jgi:hypothetical protein